MLVRTTTRGRKHPASGPAPGTDPQVHARNQAIKRAYDLTRGITERPAPRTKKPRKILPGSELPELEGKLRAFVNSMRHPDRSPYGDEAELIRETIRVVDEICASGCTVDLSELQLEAVKNGHLSVISHLYGLPEDKQSSNRLSWAAASGAWADYDLFDVAALHGHLHVLRWWVGVGDWFWDEVAAGWIACAILGSDTDSGAHAPNADSPIVRYVLEHTTRRKSLVGDVRAYAKTVLRTEDEEADAVAEVVRSLITSK